MTRAAHPGQTPQLDSDQGEIGDAAGAAYIAPREGVEATYAGSASYQTSAVDLDLDAAAGSDSDPKYLAPAMFNVLGDALTKLKTYVGAVIAKYSITGSKASSYPHAAIIAEIGDGTTGADAAVMAVLGGDSAVTTVRALFGVDNQNSTPNSKADFGLDLQGVDHDGYGLIEVTVAARLGSDVCDMVGDGAPVDGVSGTGAGTAGEGSSYRRTHAGAAAIYLNTGTKASPAWKAITHA